MPRRDDFDDEESLLQKLLRRDGMSPMPQSMARTLMIMAAVGIMAVVVIIGWATWPGENGRVDEASLPVMRADETAYKVKPDEPGGVAIPNKDSTIFNALNTTPTTGPTTGPTTDEGGKTIENLLDETEQPVKKDEVLAAGEPSPPDHEVQKIEPSANAAPPSSDELKDPAAEGADKPRNIIDELKAESSSPEGARVAQAEQAEQKSESKNADISSKATPQLAMNMTAGKESAPQVTPRANSQATPQTPKQAAKQINPQNSAPKPVANSQAVTLKSVEAAPSVKVSPGASYVQFAAVKSDSDARANWAKLQGKYPALKSLSLRVQKIDLGAKGVFYRVQGGPVAASSAQSICGQVKQGGGQCIVIR